MTTISLTFANQKNFSPSYDHPEALVQDLLRLQFENHLDAREALVRWAPKSDFYNL